MDLSGAKILVGRQIGLPASFDGSKDAYRNLTPTQQVEFTKALIRFINSNPGDFSEAQVNTAAAESGRVERISLEDTSYSALEFLDELENQFEEQIANPLAQIGRGVSTSVSLVGTLIPFLVIVAIVVFGWPYIRKAFKS